MPVALVDLGGLRNPFILIDDLAPLPTRVTALELLNGESLKDGPN